MNLTYEDPILFLGVDIGIKRDTSAISAVYRHHDTGLFCLWGIRIFPAPVNMLTQVEPLLFWLFQNHRIAACAFDETQFASTQARLEADGYANKLLAINQNTTLKKATSTLHAHCNDRQFLPHKDSDLRSQISWCSVKHTEQGPHITKSNQNRQIDGVVATAMALLAATGDLGFVMHQGFDSQIHAKSAMSLP